MAVNSLKHKPTGAVSALDHDLSVLHTPSENNPFSEKTNAANAARTASVSRLELWAARIGFFTGGFTVASWARSLHSRQHCLPILPLARSAYSVRNKLPDIRDYVRATHREFPYR